MRITSFVLSYVAAIALTRTASAQSSDWQQVIWRDPQVRYLLADLCLNGGKTDLYRRYATEEKDPDSREAIRLWDAGVRVVNTNEFDRKWVPSQFAENKRMMRIVHRGSERTITGNEVLLTSDYTFDELAIRLELLAIAFGKPVAEAEAGSSNANTHEAIRRWKGGARISNLSWFEARGNGVQRRLYFKGTDALAKGSQVRLNCDVAYPEANVRYFLADMNLGGSRDFYWRTAEIAHEMGCLEAVLRYDASVKITNLDQFERKRVDGKVLITRKGSNERISGNLVRLSTDQ